MRHTLIGFFLLLGLLTLAPGQAQAFDRNEGHGRQEQMAKLEELQKSDPAKFKAETQRISDELAQKAKEIQDPRKSQRLTAMSEKFAEASRTGDMTSLQRHGRSKGESDDQSGYRHKGKSDSGQREY